VFKISSLNPVAIFKIFELFTDVLLDSPIQAEFKLMNQRGRSTVIIVDEMGFSYSCSSKAGQTVKTWRCSKRKQKNCPALIKTDMNWILSKRNYHTHEISDLCRAVSVKSDDPLIQEYLRNY
jgi:hypothetical protein